MGIVKVTVAIDEAELLAHDAWRMLVRARANGRCERCGRTERSELAIGRRMYAHHRDGNGKNHRLKNGEFVCMVCHSRRHFELGIGIPNQKKTA